MKRTRPEPEYYTIVDAAAVTSVSPSTIYRAAQDGEIPLCKARGRSLIKRTDLHAWIAAGPVTPSGRDIAKATKAAADQAQSRRQRVKTPA